MRMRTLLYKGVFSRLFWSITAGVFVVLFVAMMIATNIVYDTATAALNMFFGTSNTITLYDKDAQPYYPYTTNYEFLQGRDEYNAEDAKTLYEKDSRMIEKAVGEGAVLLWNKAASSGENKALPLVGNEKISAFGQATIKTTYSGTGSGYVENKTYAEKKRTDVNLKEALESRGFSVNPTLWSYYTSRGNKMTDDKTYCHEWRTWYVNEANWNSHSAAAKNSLSSYNDVAIIVLARSGGEHSDIHYNYETYDDLVGANDRGGKENTSAEGGFLGLTDDEESILRAVTSDAQFKKVVLLLNTPNPIQFRDLSPYYSGIDSCMWIGAPGTTGLNAVADLLKGKDMNGNVLTPSGRLSDTFAYDNNSAPAAVNDGNYKYAGDLSGLKQEHATRTNFFNTFMIYQEGIYVGYRYYETRYADCVTGEGNASSEAGAKNGEVWEYEKEVAFPFGYGESYTKFDYSGYSAVKNSDGDYDVTVTVKNTGGVPGKEVVQVYLQKPYTKYDRDNKIEKSAVELAGYAKTKLLAAGESDTLKITVPAEFFKTYDANNKKTYIIEAGKYYLTVGNDAHSAVNNILRHQGKTVTGGKHFGDYEKLNLPNVGAFVTEFELADDFVTYSVSAQTGVEITNRFDDGDINKYKYRGDNSTVYLSRNDWKGTYPEPNSTNRDEAKLTMNADLAKDLDYDTIPDDSGVEMPTYNTFASGATDGLPIVSAGDRVAYEFIEAPLTPEKAANPDEEYKETGRTYREWAAMWEQLLDQMTFEEQALMAANAYHQLNGASSVALPSSKQENGPVGFTNRGSQFPTPNASESNANRQKIITDYYFIAYPCVGLIAASFNNEISREVGEHMGEDAMYLGYNGIYGPGVNMHRTPFGGRAFEYPSEDPFLAGTIAYWQSNGIESKGSLAFAKHFALNDSETNRCHVGVWSNEQASREIYLRAFEITFAEGGASATMNSFTRVGAKWNGGCYAMMTEVLRNEWGWDGINITDWYTSKVMSYVDAIMAGTDSFDGNGSVNSYLPYKDNAAVCQALRTSAKRIIYNVVRTNVMNGTSINTRVIKVTPWWKSALTAISIGLGITAGCTVALAAVSWVFAILDKRKASGEPGGGNDDADVAEEAV